MKRYGVSLLVVALIASFVLGSGEITRGEGGGTGGGIKETAIERVLSGPNLLVNGNMEQLPFYWKAPNHFVAGGWLRWWIGDDIPEYDDVRSWRPQRYDGDHAQVYFRWGQTYTAGIYQRVTVEPCRFYQFSMYGRNHSHDEADHHARLGIDPFGRVYNTIDEPGVPSLPADIVWGEEQTYYYQWGLHTVTAESQGNAITAIAYASPEAGHGYYDTFWDAGSLVESDPPDGFLPEPDSWMPSGFIYNLSVVSLLDQVVVTWETTSPASTQVWYNKNITTTDNTYTYATPPEMTPTTQHRVVVDGLQSGDSLQLVAVSRRFTGSACTTEVSEAQVIHALQPAERLPGPNSWAPADFIQNVTVEKVLDNVVVRWETPSRASASQVWYDVSSVITGEITSTLTVSNPVYLPVIYHGPDNDYEFATYLDLRPVQQHQAVIRDLSEGDTVCLVAVSSYVANDQVFTYVSGPRCVYDIQVPDVILDIYVPAVVR